METGVKTEDTAMPCHSYICSIVWNTIHIHMQRQWDYCVSTCSQTLCTTHIDIYMQAFSIRLHGHTRMYTSIGGIKLIHTCRYMYTYTVKHFVELFTITAFALVSVFVGCGGFCWMILTPSLPKTANYYRMTAVDNYIVTIQRTRIILQYNAATPTRRQLIHGKCIE